MERYFEIKAPGHNVRCKLYCDDPRKAARVVLFCTGFAGHKDNNAAHRLAEKLLSKEKGAAVLVFNWPAHGDDVKKKLCLADCDAYLTLVLNEIGTRFGIERPDCCATSFGGYLALKYISEHGMPFRRLALRCPAVPMYEVLTNTIMGGDDYDRLLRGKDVSVGFDRKIVVTRAFLDSLRENDIRERDYLDWADDILIVHGTADEVVPFESSRAFAEQNVIELLPVERADHRFQNPKHLDLAIKYFLQFFGA